MGGRTALEFAALYQENTLGLIIEDMHISSVPASSLAIDPALKRFDKVSSKIKTTYLNKNDALEALKEFYSLEESLWVLSSGYQSKDSYHLRCRPESTELYLHQGLAVDMSSSLKKIKCPIEFFAGDPKDFTTQLNKQKIDQIKSINENIKINVFDGFGHGVHTAPSFPDKVRESFYVN
jgi:pimeloyl-ACP methyl ester carboxylesterase